MSVRAYRINKIVRKQNASFNLWHCEELCKYFDRKINGTVDEGMFEVSVEVLQGALKAIADGKIQDVDEYIVNQLRDDIKWAEENDDYYVTYMAF